MQQIVHNWDTALYNDKHSFVVEYGAALIDLLDPKSYERILDLGCGSGELTTKIRTTAASVVGIDNSPDMIANAQMKSPLGEYHVADASNFEFDEPFDAIFSNAVLHWVVAYKEAISCMYTNLKQGGRLVVEFGGKGNVGAITDQLRKSLVKRGYEKQSRLQLWYFPTIGEYTSALEAKGFRIKSAQWFDRPTELADEETGIKDWLIMFCKPFLATINDSEVMNIINEVQTSLKSRLYRNGKWFADYKRIRIIAYK